MTDDLFGDVKGARDEALARVLDNAGKPWSELALSYLRDFLLTHQDFIAEDFRVWATQRGLPMPHHHNAWGALLPVAAGRGWVRITDRTRSMQTMRSHARRSPVWQTLVGR